MTGPACGGSGPLAGMWQQRADVVVIGTGVAGLTAALAAHRAGRSVVVLSKAAPGTGATATFHAQGGIAVALGDDADAVATHVADTVAAGGGLCDPHAVESIVADGRRAVAQLVGDGARFDEVASGQWSLTREGGHSRRRIIHAGGDATGAEVQRALDAAAERLDIRYEHVAAEILLDDGAVVGVQVLSPQGMGVLHTAAVILATGGLGQLYAATTNPAGSTGDGIALALRAGAAVSDLEFIQFHPTMLFAAPSSDRADTRRPLITEALRGEGAILVDAQGNSVMDGLHPMRDLAPRDVVAAAIDANLRTTGSACVYLDARSIAGFEARFPTVTASCRAVGIDPTRQPIPVVPGAHYSCGGVVTDVAGRTDVPGLFAAGEVARTGMHGANRLASNSLLEGLVVGGRAGRSAADHAASVGAVTARAVRRDEHEMVERSELQHAMSRDASVVRDGAGLARLTETLAAAHRRPASTRARFEDAVLTVTARAVALAAAERTETRGSHHRSDHPLTDESRARSTMLRMVDEQLVVDAPVVA
ncbi:L-aspartate oxidase [Mycolicibacterium chitae]|uniref:L-aspartate oxidase n=1 Tax=Mycolicibacterium chitae TaxID=1792 RepID=A0A3S4VIA8_MYCCI|nr:L-aspartate oxidase [Mycolicibacterium chitae]VEG48249.1 L-aspartate oxidase [Mycolicibacterium chitae]